MILEVGRGVSLDELSLLHVVSRHQGVFSCLSGVIMENPLSFGGLNRLGALISSLGKKGLDQWSDRLLSNHRSLTVPLGPERSAPR